jgi:hypothetical protein
MGIYSINLFFLNRCVTLSGKKSFYMLDFKTSSILRVNNGGGFISGGK